nr:efflux RND transporter periplasmic adaptor subunit [Caldimonas sp.]
MDQPPDDRALPALAPSAPALPPAKPVRGARRWFGTIVAFAALIALAALAWWLLHRPPEGPGGAAFAASGAGRGGAAAGGPGGGRGARGAPPSTVGVATATRADLPIVLDALGTVTPIVTVTVRPQVSGQITQVLYSEGQVVKKGQLLVTIDPRPFEAALQQAIGARMRDEAQLENAKVQLQRYRTLLSQDSIARQDVDTQAATVKQLEASIVTDRANENTARLNLGWSRIVAPVAGRVGLRPIDVGNTISAGDANGVAVITQVEPIDVAFAVP